VEYDAAHQLDIEVTHAGGALRSLPNNGEDLDQLGVQYVLNQDAALPCIVGQIGDRLTDPVTDDRRALTQGAIVEGLELGLECVDVRDDRAQAFEISLVLGAEDGFNAFFDQIHGGFLGPCLPFSPVQGPAGGGSGPYLGEQRGGFFHAPAPGHGSVEEDG